ncbi:MAG TPA: hypothetical protein VN597_11010 [Streptosporangiaceae bacterium]|nr:hypothetical protein [Streptosporangiaceae bacterium]
MTTLDREYEDVVRRALIAAAESIEPAGDGLQRIRHQLSSPRSMTSLTASFTEWLRLSGIRFSVRLEPAAGTGRAALGQVRHLFTGPGLRPGPFLTRGQASGEYPGGPPGRRGSALGRLGPAAAWLRPVLAVAAVVAVVAVAVLAVDRSQRTLFTPTNSVSAHHADAGGPATAAAETASLRPWEPLGVVAVPAGASSAQGTKHTLVPAVACSPKASVSPSPPITAASAAPTPTATPTDTPSATPTPTPSVTPSVTTSPSVTPTPTDSGVSTSGSEATPQVIQATPAAFILPAGAQQPASTSCGGTTAKVTPTAPPATPTS